VAGGAANDAAHAGEGGPARGRSHLIAWAALGIALAMFVVVNWDVLGSRFGDSHDGRNAAVWASGSRALREDGLLTSRLGGIGFDGERYANHPPLILFETATTETVLGEHPWSTRLPAALSTIGAALLTFLTCRRLAIGSGPAAIGTALAFTTPMALVYGAMLDTPVTSLLLGAAVAHLVARASGSDRQIHPALVTTVAVLASLSGWEAALLCLVTAGLCALSGSSLRRMGLWLALGALSGTAASLAWGSWVYDGPATLLDVLRFRTSGTEQVTFIGSLSEQLDNAVSLFGPLLAGFAGAVWSCFRGSVQVRLVSRALVVTTLLYPMIFFNGAYFHSYWNYWMILPIALGLAVLAARAWELGERTTLSRAVRIGGAVAVTAVLGLALLPRTLGYRTETIDGAAPVDLATATAGAPDATTVDIGNLYGAESWIEYTARSDHREVATADEARELVAHRPDAVLVSPSARCAVDPDLCSALKSLLADAAPRSDGWIVVPFSDLVQRLDR